MSNYPGIYSVSPTTWGDFGVKQYTYADREWLLHNGEAFRKQLTGSAALTAYDPVSLFDGEEKTGVIYGKSKFGFNVAGLPVSGVAGVRMVRTEQHLVGNSRNAAINVITPVDVNTSRTDALPSLWVAPLSTLDASAGYTINKSLTISVDVTNLLNQSHDDFFDKNPAMVSDVRDHDRTVGLSARWRL